MDFDKNYFYVADHDVDDIKHYSLEEAGEKANEEFADKLRRPLKNFELDSDKESPDVDRYVHINNQGTPNAPTRKKKAKKAESPLVYKLPRYRLPPKKPTRKINSNTLAPIIEELSKIDEGQKEGGRRKTKKRKRTKRRKTRSRRNRKYY